MSLWNPWHGCTKCSPGCRNCYVYRRDAEFGKDASIVKKTVSFNLPVKKDRRGNYKLKPEDGTVMTCFTSDFFHPDADAWRPEAWQINRDNAGIKAKLIKRSYLGSFFEYTFETSLGQIFVVSPDLTNVLDVGTEIGLSLADHGVSVVKAN